MKNILVVRNDKIGDFMLAWPSFAMLKLSVPDMKVTALVPRYTAALAEMCPWIDDVVIDPGKKGSKEDQQELISTLKAKGFDGVICLFSDTYNALTMWRARIPYRLAPATKFAQVLYNHRVVQRRSRSEKPEYQYNLDLIRAFLAKQGIPAVEPSAPYLQFADSVLTEQKEKLAAQLSVDAGKHMVFIHAGTGGSANALTLPQYVSLMALISADYPVEFVLTAGPGEGEHAASLKNLAEEAGIISHVYDKNDGLKDFCQSIACASLFIAGSTGPLHIAAAIDVPTIGFFPSKRSSTPLRWLTLNSDGNHLGFCPPEKAGESADLSLIDINKNYKSIQQWMKEKNLFN